MPEITVGPGKLHSRVIYLEMRELPFDDFPSHLEGNIEIIRDFDVTPESYLELYRKVGEEWLWGDRLKLSTEELEAIIYDPKVEIYTLRVDGELTGYVELDLRIDKQVEVAYCGIFPQFVGQGLGGPLLRHGLKQAFRNNPERVWIHTCNQDHPNALGFYEHIGFSVYKEEDTTINDPRVLGLIPKHVQADRFPIVE
ncbi:MAG: GNAT family N-acetyltransferase [Rhodospirillales bacterium]|nr:GNAT family N-acetyltransferase [Rhodospirillales bacterium]